MYSYALLENVYMADVIMIEAAHGEQGETIHGHADPHPNTPNSEHMKCIVPDSFEYSQCDDYKTNQEKLSSDLAEAGRSTFNIEMCSQKLLAHEMPNITSTSHASEMDFEDSPQNFDVCIPESVLDDMSPKDLVNSERDGEYSGVKENPAHVSLSSAQKDFPTAQDYTGGNVFMIFDIHKTNYKYGILQYNSSIYFELRFMSSYDALSS